MQRIILTLFFTMLFCLPLMAQKNNKPLPVSVPEAAAKLPYQIYTNGRQITIRSTVNLKQLMVWSASGHRVVEQKDMDKDSYAFRLDVNEKIFFLRIQLVNGKLYTQKIGI